MRMRLRVRWKNGWLLFCAMLVLFTPQSTALAGLGVPSFFTDHMVLQRDKPIRIWGEADAGEQVTVTLGDHVSRAKTGADGRWSAQLGSLDANATGQTITIRSGTESVTIHDVLIGEVWFASGQSNMAFTLRGARDSAEEIAAADHPGVRMFLAKPTPAATLQTDIQGEWNVSSPSTAGSFSAVAYFFALNLHRELNVPVGVIKSAWGGKPCETFTSAEALATVPFGRELLAQLKKAADAFEPDAAQEKYEKALARWEAATATVRAENRGLSRDKRKRLPRKPAAPRNPLVTEGQPAVLFNGMIHPFVGYTMRGAIWYQGEANAKPGKAEHYHQMYSLMIRDWRKHWQDEFSFLTVQLANFRPSTSDAGATSDWATVQNAQRLTLAVPRTGLAVINDVGEEKNIHPKDKQTVGYRLALWALANDYHRDIVFSGPLYRSHSIERSEVRVTFDHTGEGLKSRDGKPLNRFEVAGSDGKWHWATARIEDNTVIVRCPEVAKPVSVRYAWADNPEGANLVNSANLPASVFTAGGK